MPGPYYWQFLVDPATFVLLLSAALSILYGSYRSIGFLITLKESLELDTNTVKVRTAILLPIFGSIFLVALFFWLRWLYWLLLVLISLIALTAVAFVIYPYVDKLLTKLKWNKSWDVRWIGDVTVSGIVSFVLSLGLLLTWLFTGFFILTDLLAVCMAVMTLCFVKVPNMMISTILLTLFFLYDIFWVFISEYIFTKNVMVTVATNLPSLPMVIVFPRVLSQGYSLLGLGDIVLPGLFLCFLYRFDNRLETPFKHGYFLRAWIAYIFGLFFTFVMALLLQRGQPALLYLVPATLPTTAFFGWRRGELRHLWKGTHPRIPVEELPISIHPDSGNSANEATVSLLSDVDQNKV